MPTTSAAREQSVTLGKMGDILKRLKLPISDVFPE